MGELHCTNMIFRRQLITAATAIITLTVLLASTDAAHIEDTVVPESTDSVRLVETGNGGWDYTVNAFAQQGQYPTQTKCGVVMAPAASASCKRFAMPRTPTRCRVCTFIKSVRA